MILELTPEEATNLLALINRAQITGAEAEVAVALKQKLLAALPEPSVNGAEALKALA
jgi:hypothetical protein